MRVCFGDYVLDSACSELTRGPERIAIGPQAFDLLVYLVMHRDRVVSKEDLLEAVWHGRIVSESTLSSHINAVRKAVGDSGEQQSLIRTIARKGYRFIGQVNEQPPGGERAPSNHLAQIRDGASAAQPDLVPLPDKPSIAVLPFENLSGDALQEYFADGVVEDIITALAHALAFRDRAQLDLYL